MKLAMITLNLLLGAVFSTSALAAQPDAQPKMNGKLRVVPMEQHDQFFTGKPYDEDLGTYLFAFRNYDPELKRWTTADPAGFPDGANNHFYAPVPTLALDVYGLWQVKLVSASSTVTWYDNVWYDGWGWGNDTLNGAGSLQARVAPQTAADSISILGSATAWWTEEGWGLNITQRFTVSVNSVGELWIEATGTAQNKESGLTVAVAPNTTSTPSGRTLTLTYGIASIYQAGGLTGVGGTLLGLGGNFSWDPVPGQVSGLLALTFEAVE